MENSIATIWTELTARATKADLDFLRKCFRAYSSKAHVSNVMHDLALLRRLSPPPNRILDFGCGIGLQSFLLSLNGYDVYGLETTEDKSLDGFFKGKAESHIATRDESMKIVWSIIKKSAKVDFRFYDGAVQPFTGEHFDIVFAYAVLEHIPPQDVPGVLGEIQRVLKPDGRLYIFQLPRRTSYTEFLARKLGLESHPYLWDLKSMGKVLNEAGFQVFYAERVDMLFNHPYKVINPLFSVMRPLNRLLVKTPLSYFAHHLTIVAGKTQVKLM